MIRSMTAYARREIKGEWGSATWEMRSVNQRYLETYFRLPEQFRSLEPVVRERIRSRLTRGKVECTLRYEPDVSAQGELILNEKLAKQLVTAANWVKMQSDEGEINPVDILRWPGVMAAQEQDLDAIAAEILAALDGTLDDFIVARETEGQALKALIEQRLEGVTAEVVKVRSHMPEILQWQRERLVAKLEDAQVQLENNRLEQELVLLRHKAEKEAAADAVAHHVLGAGADVLAAGRVAGLDLAGPQDGLAAHGGVLAPEVAAGLQRVAEEARGLVAVDGLQHQRVPVGGGAPVLPGNVQIHGNTSFRGMKNGCRPQGSSRSASCASPGGGIRSAGFIATRRGDRDGESPAGCAGEGW